MAKCDVILKSYDVIVKTTSLEHQLLCHAEINNSDWLKKSHAPWNIQSEMFNSDSYATLKFVYGLGATLVQLSICWTAFIP